MPQTIVSFIEVSFLANNEVEVTQVGFSDGRTVSGSDMPNLSAVPLPVSSLGHLRRVDPIAIAEYSGNGRKIHVLKRPISCVRLHAPIGSTSDKIISRLEFSRAAQSSIVQRVVYLDGSAVVEDDTESFTETPMSLDSFSALVHVDLLTILEFGDAPQLDETLDPRNESFREVLVTKRGLYAI